jgi:hypothetical protein
MATSRVYNLLPKYFARAKPGSRERHEKRKTEYAYEDKESGEAVTRDQVKREERPKDAQDIRDLFNAWNNLDDEGEPDDLQGSEAWSQHEMPEQRSNLMTSPSRTTSGIAS